MAFSEQYRRQVALLIRVIPLIAEEECFALKGGTAINLFLRDMPRLSVDIDLTYLPVQPRPESLAAIGAALTHIAARIKQTMPGAVVTEQASEGAIIKLLTRADQAQVLIEVTPVIRGCLYPAELRTVSSVVEDTFGFAEMPVCSFADLYAGKLVASLDRQHPRDFFDVRDLLAHEGIDDTLRRAFLVYLISHRRPMWEVLNVRRKDIAGEYERSFAGMTDKPISLEDLLSAREDLVKKLVSEMPQEHRKFLISFERGQPDWAVIAIDCAADLPAVKWRQQNLDGLSKQKRGELVSNLEKVLGVDSK
jgi:predicted nucleotidyltransferase component of viral defense system